MNTGKMKINQKPIKMFTLESQPIKAKLTAIPKNRKSQVAWFCDNNVSTNAMSLDSGVERFIDSLERNDKN